MDSYWEIRVKNIKDQVSLRSLIDFFKIECQSEGSVTQVHCPFHGNDTHASARIYETNTMYCWKCNKVWDVISFINDIKNFNDFNKSCQFLEELFGISKPDAKVAYEQKETLKDFLDQHFKNTKKEKNFEDVFSKISNKLILNKNTFLLTEYTSYFNYLDNLYSVYKTDDYEDDTFLQAALENIHKEISKRI